MFRVTAPRTLVILLAGFAAAMPLSLQAEEGVCDVRGRPAELGLTLHEIGGEELALSAYRGQVILLNFWATWCAPCKVEIPWLVELYRDYRERGLAVLGVSVNDPVERIEPFVAALNVNYPVLLGAGRDDVKEAFGPLYGFPTSVLISRDGTICIRHTGIASKEQLESEIQALL